MRALGFTVKKAEIRAMIADIDKDETGTVELAEFVQMMTGRMSQRNSREEIKKVFDLFDDERKGVISFRSLKKVAAELGEALTDDDLKEMIDEADKNGDGVIDFEEFFRVMRKRSDHPLDDLDTDDDEDIGGGSPSARPPR
jgi:centrin-1